MSSVTGTKTGKTYWRSLDELADTPKFRDFLAREFPEGAAELLSASTRRNFLKVMGASFAFAGLTGCRWPKETIVPYSRRPETYVPGKTKQYATSMELGGFASGLLVTSYDGRPIKVEGNPSHPNNQGAADALSQASILELYDPDRNTALKQRGGEGFIGKTWDDFIAFARTHFDEAQQRHGNGVHILCEASSSPSLAAMRSRLQAAMPQAMWHEYEPLSRDRAIEGAQRAFGKPYRTHRNLKDARVILSLDADFLGQDPNALKYAREFALGRKPDREMNRLYSVESVYTITGAMADHRLPLQSGQIEAFAYALAGQVVTELDSELPEEYQPLALSILQHADPAEADDFVKALAKDLVAHRGNAVIFCGLRQPASLHVLVHFLNEVLGARGRTISYTEDPEAARPSYGDAIRSLTKKMHGGTVKTLIVIGGNPVYDAPADLDFAGGLKKVPVSIHLSLYENETSLGCVWNLPRAHYLESWGDTRAYDGTLCTQQPLIAPIYDGKSAIELLSIILGEPMAGYELVRRTISELENISEFESFWRTLLHEGVLSGSQYPVIEPELQVQAVRALFDEFTPTEAAESDYLELVFYQDPRVYDGRFANIGWLQELPDFLTKITWDNAALISPSTAEALGIQHQDMIEVDCGGKKAEIVAYVMPGQAPNSIALSLGYGRAAAGKVGNGVGFNVYPLRTSAEMDYTIGAEIRRTGQTYELACTQDHFAIDTVGMRERSKRIGQLVREATLDHYEEHPDFAHHIAHEPEPAPLWKEHEYDGQKWGLTVDLNLCIGCNACVASCQAENNIPVVGKEEVANGREMHWLRIDRYFSGDPESPEVAHQPVACVQCENAPCEQVCPVGATMHDHEGLNVMVYNRCVGTRYCSNNCPYKVRRFNYFNNHKNLKPVEMMKFNPEVTVRSRGVMEKCTYCSQRIQAKKIESKNERRSIADGEIRTACQQTCPTNAIVFGDLNDPQSEVAKLHKEQRAYEMLGELNIKPRTLFLAKIRNPNPELEGEETHGSSHDEHSSHS